MATGGKPWRLEDRAPLPWRPRRIIQRPHEPAFAFQQPHHFLLVPEMIAARDDIHPAREDFLRRLDRDARAAGGVLAIGHHQVQGRVAAAIGEQAP